MNKELIELYKNKIIANNYEIKRWSFEHLKNEIMDHNLILIGLRQLGKTILGEQLVHHFLDNKKPKKIDDSKVSLPSNDDFLYLNLKSFSGLTSEKIQTFVNKNKYEIVFIDEVQVIEKWSNMVQVLVDLNKDTRFIFTGSNATSLSQETAFGRAKIYNIFPLTYNEYKKIWEDENFNDWLFYGSYPKISGYKSVEIQYREMIHSLVFDKVANEDHEGISVAKLTNFAEGITNYIGNEINLSVLARDSDLSRPTVPKYIKVMKDASLIRTIAKYKDKQSNPKNKVYFVDKSMLPYFIRERELNNNQKGALIENVVFSKLLNEFCFNYGTEEIFYYRDESGSEIDFIIPNEKILIEVKFVANIDFKSLVADLNDRISKEFQDYRKIIITQDLKMKYLEWEFIPLLEYLGGK